MKTRWLAAVLLIASTVAFGQDFPAGERLLLSHPPGSYRSDIWLRARVRESDASVEMRFAGVDYFLPLRRPLHLTAMAGEERRYDLELRVVEDGRVRETTAHTFVIDKRAPVPPAVSAVSGVYTDRVRVEVSTEPDATAEYTLNRPLAFEPEQWPGSILVLESGEESRHVSLRVRSVDEAGNRSDAVIREYTIVPGAAIPATLSIVSPIPGEFANRQLLYVEAPPRWPVYYAYGDVDPTTDGTAYRGPVPVSGDGPVVLRVAARDDEGRWHREEVTLTQGNADIVRVESGAYTAPIQLEPPPETRVRVDEAAAVSDGEPVALAPQRGVFRAVPVEMIRDGMRFRYLYLLEGRDPGVPEVFLRQEGSRAILSASARPEARIFYAADDTHELYRGPVALTLPVAVASGRLEVTAATRLPSGVAGPDVGASLVFDTEPPRAPVVTLSPVATGLRIGYERAAETRVVYELGDLPVTNRSPELVDGAVLEAPFGLAIDTVLSARTVDDAGNLSADTVEVPVLIDRLPPPTPTIAPDEGTITLAGSGELLYQVQPPIGLETTDPESDRADGFHVYREPLDLRGEANRRVEYRISALAMDAYGNASPIVEETVVVNRRNPVVPPPAGIADGGVYNLPSVTVSFRDPDPDLELYYTISRDGESPPNPTLEDSRFTGPFQVSGEPGEEIEVKIKVLPYYPRINRAGEVREISVILDREPPNLPTVRGVASGSVTTTPPLIEILPAEVSDTVFYAIGTDDAVDALGAAGRIYSNPFEATVPRGQEAELTLDIAVRDRAGNIVRLDSPIEFTVDRKQPEVPNYRVRVSEAAQSELRGAAAEALSFGEAVRLSLLSEEAVYYEITNDGRIPPLPGLASEQYAQEILLPGIPGAVVQYNIAAIAVDRAGNRSDILEILGLTVDREPPGLPPEPTIRLLDADSGMLAWDVPEGNRLLYQLGDGEGFETYESVREIGLPGADEQLVLRYLLVDEAGNRGALRETEITVRPEPVPPRLVGIESGAISGEAVTISDTLEQGVVRYEIAELPSRPAPITRFSPALTESLRVDVAPGRTASYEIRARRFVGDVASEPATLRFTVDRANPDPPTLVGVEAGGYYENEQTVTLSSEEGRIYVAVRRDVSELDSELSFVPYSGPISLGAEEGDLASYTVFAYTEDAAGNRSEPTVSWQVFIDREVIYVAPGGSDGGDGSRLEPFATLGRALEYARTSERGTIFLAEGTYVLDEPVAVSGALSLVGGYNPTTWQRDGTSRSVLRRSERAGNTDGMFLVSEGDTLNASGIRVVETKGFWQTVIANDGGTVTITDAAFSLSGRTVAVRSRGGSVRVSGSQVSMNRTSAATVFDVQEGAAELRGVTVELVDLVSSFEVVRSVDARVRMANVEASMQSGWMMRGIAATGGTVELTDVTIRIRNAREGATGISVTEGSLIGTDIAIALHGAPYALGVRLDGGGAEIAGGAITVRDVLGATGISANDADLVLRNGSVDLASASQFAYGVSGRNASLSVLASTISSTSDGESFVTVVEGTSVRLVHVSARVGGSPRTAGGVNASGAGELTVMNTILVGPGVGVGIAASEEIRDGGVSASNIGGWSVVRTKGTRRFETIDAVNRYYRNLSVLGRLDSFAPNTSVPADRVFRDFPRMRPSSPLIDAGAEIEGLELTDIDGEPIPREGTRRDVGADEFYPSSP